jgi:hypothetical protein
MTSDASGTIVALATMQQNADGLPEGFEVEGTTSYDFSRFEMSFESPAKRSSVYYANDGGNFGIALVECGTALRHLGHRMETRVSGAEIPVPIEASAASSELSLTVPLAASPEPSDAAVAPVLPRSRRQRRGLEPDGPHRRRAAQSADRGARRHGAGAADGGPDERGGHGDGRARRESCARCRCRNSKSRSAARP